MAAPPIDRRAEKRVNHTKCGRDRLDILCEIWMRKRRRGRGRSQREGRERGGAKRGGKEDRGEENTRGCCAMRGGGGALGRTEADH